MNEQTTVFDLLILGGGPIGAATLYNVAKKTSDKRIGLLTNDKEDDVRTTFYNSGGSIRTHWDDPLKREMTEETTELIHSVLAEGVDLLENKDSYFFTYTGAYTPSLNISAKKLVAHLLQKATTAGAIVKPNTEINSIEHTDGIYIVHTGTGTYTTKSVLLALGIENEKFMPGLQLEKEKRQLFVLDTPVSDEVRAMPHTIVKVGEDGYGYVFVKKFPEGWRVVLGQEDIVDDENRADVVNYFPEIIASDLTKTFPWLAEAKVEKILWGVDAGNKKLRVETDAQGRMLSANCGSAARGCAYIGRTLAEQLLQL